MSNVTAVSCMISLVAFRFLSGKEHAHTIHGFEVKICASKASSIDEVGSGSSKVSSDRNLA